MDPHILVHNDCSHIRNVARHTTSGWLALYEQDEKPLNAVSEDQRPQPVDESSEDKDQGIYMSMLQVALGQMVNVIYFTAMCAFVFGLIATAEFGGSYRRQCAMPIGELLQSPLGSDLPCDSPLDGHSPSEFASIMPGSAKSFLINFDLFTVLW